MLLAVIGVCFRVDFRFAPSQWETVLLCNNVSHWLGTSVESALYLLESGIYHPPLCKTYISPHAFLIWFNTLRLRQNGRYFPDAIFKCIFLNENCCILMKISLKFIPQDPTNNIPALVQIMAWRRPGDKPLSEPMMAWLNDAYLHHSASMSVISVVLMNTKNPHDAKFVVADGIGDKVGTITTHWGQSRHHSNPVITYGATSHEKFHIVRTLSF